ncbi:MAG: dihydrodipicolinate synthase family protein [Acidimicrobiia bacterium]|nr:dihydrodipicolinate synthase family protein [Acidimicrobiia bacterium]
MGAVGVVGVATHWAGEVFAELVSSFDTGDHEGARAANARLLPSYEYWSSDETPSPLPAKAAMRALGLAVGDARPPMGPSPEALDARARAVVADVRP